MNLGMRRLAEATGMTEGQAYTLAIGLVVALTTAAIGIPPTLRDRVLPAALARPPAATSAPPGAGEAASPEPPPAGAPDLVAAPAFVPAASDRPAGASSFAVEPASPPSTTAPAAEPGAVETGELGDVERYATAPGGPQGIAVAADGRFYVATASAGVVRFRADGRLERDYELDGPLTGVLLDGDRLLVLRATGDVLSLDVRTGRSRRLATIEPTLPTVTPSLVGIVAGPDGGFLVSDAAQGVLWHVTEQGEVTEWYRGPELASADGAGPAGLAVEADGSVLVAVSRSALAFTGAVLRIQPGAPPEQLWRSSPVASLGGLAVGPDGRIHVAAGGTPGVVVLEPDGTEVTTVTDDALEGPICVALRGRSLLVTDASGTIARLPLGS